MRAVKRSPAYRRVRRELAAVCPLDVWREDGIGFAHFEGAGDGLPASFVFAVELRSGALLAAKRLAPAHPREVGVSELRGDEEG